MAMRNDEASGGALATAGDGMPTSFTAEERARLFAEGADAVAQPDGTVFYRNGTAVRDEGKVSFDLPWPDADVDWSSVQPLNSDRYVAIAQSGGSWEEIMTVQILDRDGDPLGEPTQANEIPGILFDGMVVPMAGEKFSVLFSSWDNDLEFGEFLQRRYDGTTALAPGEERIGGGGTQQPGYPDVFPTADGGFLLAYDWTNEYGDPGSYVEVRRFGPDGALLERYVVGDRPHITEPRTELWHENPRVAELSDGNVVVAYSERLFRDDGSPLRYERLGTKLQIFRPDGTRAGEPVEIGGADEDMFVRDVAGLVDGRFVVTWQSGSATYARLHAPDGTPLGDAFNVGPNGGGALVALPDGGFFAGRQRFDAEGEPLGDGSELGEGSVFVRPDGDVVFTSGNAAQVYAALDYHVLTPGGDAVPGANTDGLIVTDPEDLGATDSIHGGGGEDTLELSASGVLDLTAPAAFDGVEVLLGASGGDVFVASGGRLADVTRIDGRGGFDVIKATGGSLNLSGVALAGIERIEGGSGADAITGSAAADVIFGLQGDDTIRGGAGGDRLDGSRGDDVVEGGEGDDTLLGGEGSDTADYGAANQGVSVRLATGTATGAEGEVGSDTLVSIENVRGGQGGDRIVGDAMANLLVGDTGDDFLEGGRNDDTLRGGAGDDTLQGALDHDLLEGGAGLDHLRGDSGNDTLLGGGNNDRLVGGAGNDRLEGDGGADELRGESGRDVLVGGAAGDRLYGGYGADVLTGGSGADRFFLTAIGETGTTAATRDMITDFEVGTDVINLAKINAVQGGGGNAALSFIGTDEFTAAGQLRFFKDVANNRTIVEGNVNADLAADFRIELLGLHDLSEGDLVL